MDLGVGPDCLGNLDEAAELLPGATRKDRVHCVWRNIQHFYREAKPDSQLQALTPEMVRASPTEPPKLRAKAAERRHLVPFGLRLAQKLDNGQPHRQTVRCLLEQLMQLTRHVSKDTFDAAQLVAAFATCPQLFKLKQLNNEATSGGANISCTCSKN